MKKVVVRTPTIGPTKTVTIRGVNQYLYDRFSQLSTTFGDTTGQIFSRLIKSYGKQYHPFFVSPGARHQFLLKHNHTAVEVISDLEELKISKSNLTEAGEEVRYMFRNIGRLIFDETIDNKTMMKHVLRIRNCNLETKGKLSFLFLKSINQRLHIDKYFDDLDPESTNVTIRNVSEEAYAEFTAACQTNRVKIGDAVTDLLKRSLPHFEISQIMIHDPKLNPVDMVVLSMHDEIRVANKDLLDLEGRKILFHRVKHLIFEEDVSGENFKNTVLGIYNCQIVEMNENIPILLQHSRTKQYP